MRHESEVFLPSNARHRKQGRSGRASPLASFLFTLFEESLAYAYVLFFVFTFAVYVGTLTTYDAHRIVSARVLYYVELGIFLYCCIEFVLRIYASNARERYRGLQGKRRFFCEHYLIIDALLLFFYAVLFLWNSTPFYQSQVLFLHGLRFLQLLRFIPLDRHVRSIPLISSIIWQYRRVLLGTVYLCFLLLLPTAYLLWIVEKSIKTNDLYFFKTYTDSLWFTINSMATIGYGDTWPQTLLGRFLTSTLCCLGVVLWTLPAGIISAGLTAVDEKRRDQEYLRQPAARLILAWWRLRALQKRSRSVPGSGDEKETCRRVIADLVCARQLREFRQCRYGVNKQGDIQIREDLDRILRHLEIIEKRLNDARPDLPIEL